jgi:hypothetical protein
MSVKCPKCEKLTSSFNLKPVSLKAGRTSYHGVAYSCPFCFSAVGVQMDPIALRTDVLNGVKELLGKRKL